jgi:hypothetical protein
MLDRSRLDEPKPPRRHLGACTIRGAIGGCLGVGQFDRLVARVWVVYIMFCVCVCVCVCDSIAHSANGITRC